MSDRQPETDARYQEEHEEAARIGYFAPLAPAKGMLLTTFRRDGPPVSAAVPGVVDGGRAYFGAWSGSGSVKRLRHSGMVQVTPCSMRGFFTQASGRIRVARLFRVPSPRVAPAVPFTAEGPAHGRQVARPGLGRDRPGCPTAPPFAWRFARHAPS